MQLNANKKVRFHKDCDYCDVVMVWETAQLMENFVTDVVERTTLLKNASKVIMMLNQSHATGPGVRVTKDKCKSCGKYKKDFSFS